MIHFRSVVLIFILFLTFFSEKCPSQINENLKDFNKKHFVKKIADIKKFVVTIEAYSTSPHKKSCRIGTGFLINKQGIIVTRVSITAGSDSIIIVQHDGTRGSAKVINTINGTTLIYSDVYFNGEPDFGDSSVLENGANLTVIGNSFGIFPSVMVGEYMGRFSHHVMKLNIILAAGNTGSPVLNRDGEIVGIITGRYDRFSMKSKKSNLGLFMPIEIVKKSVRKIIDPGNGWVGITVVDSDENNKNIVTVIKVIPNGPAEIAEIQVGDIIVGFENNLVYSAKQLAKEINRYPPKDIVSFKIQRDTNILYKKVTLGDLISFYKY